MVQSAPYSNRRCTRAASLIEFLLVAAIGLAVLLAVVIVALVWFARATSWTTVAWTAAGLVVFGGALLIMLWLWVTDHWDGDHWRILANRGRSGERRTVRAPDGTPLHVEVEGPADALVTVVFCHGIALNASAWRYQRAALAGSAVRRVSYDVRGHGLSGKGLLDQSVRGVRQLAQDLGAVIDDVAPAGYVVLAGHSLGGMTALALPVVRPDLRARIGGYVLCSTTAGPLRRTMTYGLWRIFAPLSALFRRETPGFLRFLDLVPQPLRRLLGLAPYELVLRFVAVHRSNSARAVRPVAACVYDNGFRQSGDVALGIFDHDERDGLAELGAAYVTVVQPEKDRLVPPADQVALADAIPGARLRAVPDCGHVVPLERPEVVEEELLRVVALVQETADDLIGARTAPAGDPATAPTERIPMPLVKAAGSVAAPVVAAAESLVRPAVAAAESVARPTVAAAETVARPAVAASDSVRGALSNLLGTFEEMSPRGPVRSGLHLIHRVVGGDEEKPQQDEPDNK